MKTEGGRLKLRLSVLPGSFAICRLGASDAVPAWAMRGAFFTITRTAEELSIVCEEALAPAAIQAERGWRGLKLHGPIPFETTGVIASLTRPLAEAGISVSPIATYDTDYLLVKNETLAAAVKALRSAGFEVEG